MKIKYLKLDSSVPDLKQHSEGAAGFDLYNVEEMNNSTYPNLNSRIKTGIAIEIPDGYVGLIKGRSSFNDKLKVIDGIIDSDYRGEIHIQALLFCFEIIPQYTRIAQLVIIPCFSGKLIQAEELSKTKRNDKGFGSTGTS